MKPKQQDVESAVAKKVMPPQNNAGAQRRGEKRRTKRVLNVRLLLATIAIAAVACATAYLWYGYRVKQVAQLFETRAAALEKEGHWREAAGYLSRHLQFEPDDSDARDRLVTAAERSIQTPSQRRQFVGLLYEALGHMPKRNDLRLKLANQLLEIGATTEADVEAQKFLSEDGAKLQVAPTKEEQNAARRVHALVTAAQARRGGPVSIEAAIRELERALEGAPGDVTLASSAAMLYRENPLDAGTPDAVSKADAIINRLVQADPQNVDALLARYRYRRTYRVGEDYRHDLDAALTLDPDHIEALLLAADEDVSSGQESGLESAEERLQKVIGREPSDARGYVGLARLYAEKGQRQEAVDLLRVGKAKSGSTSFELDAVLAEMLLQLNRLDEAEKVLTDYDIEFRRHLPEMATDGRIRLENLGRLLRARIAIARKDFGQAVRELNAVIASVGRADVAAGALELSQAQVLRAAVMTKLGRLDLAAADWRAAAELAPGLNDARLQAASAFLELGRPAAAIAELEAYLQSPSASPQAYLALVQAHLQRQLRLAAKERNWSEFLTALVEAKKRLPGRWEPLLVEALYWHSLPNDEDKQRAKAQLQGLEQKYSSDAGLWGRLAVCYQQFDAPTDAERALARYDELETNLARRTLLRSTIWTKQGRWKEASELLADAAAAASDNDRLELQVARVRLMAGSRHVVAAQQAVSKLIAAAPDNRAMLMLGLDVALAHKDFATAARWEDALKEQQGADDFEWRFYRARRLVEQHEGLDSQTRAELESLIDSLRSDRPDWYPVVALSGRLAELAKNQSQAIDAYQLSIELGDQRAETLERLVAALFAAGRISEASSYLSRLGTDQPGSSRIDSLEIAIAYRENGPKAALELAQKVVAGGTAEPIQYVWLATLLLGDGQQAAAERTLQQSIKRFPNDPIVWNALFLFMVETKQSERARRVLEKWSEMSASGDRTKHLVLGQGYERLGDRAAAEEQYRAAIAKDSRNVEARLYLAKMLVSNDIAGAKRQFEEILNIDPNHSEARRYVASLLAASGDNEDWNRAAQLLQSGEQKSSQDVVAANRLRAILLSRRGHNREERLRNCEEAGKILAAQLEIADGAGTELDRMLLAGIYEQEAILRDDIALVLAARETLRPLVDRENPPVDYLTTYIQLLLRHLNREVKSGAAEETQGKEHRAALISDARLRIDELQEALGDNPPMERRILPTACRARLLIAEGRKEEGLRLVQEFAGATLTSSLDESDRAKLLLQLGNLCTAIGYHNEADAWYRQLVKIVPKSYILLARSLVEQNRTSEAVEICLRAAQGKPSGEIATVLAQLLASTDGDREADSRVEPLIDSALRAEGDNIELLMSVAVRNVTAGNNDQAIALLRRVVELQPNHVLALNNLATLLAERPSQLGEAKRHVERAMAVAGRVPALLDTLGTILIRADQNEQAVAALEEAVAGAASDPRYYFHLAVAYQRSGRAADAQRELDASRRLGLDRAILTNGDLELLNSLKHALTMETGETNGKPPS